MHSIVFGIQWDFFSEQHIPTPPPPPPRVVSLPLCIYCIVLYMNGCFSVYVWTQHTVYVAEHVGTAPTLFRLQKTALRIVFLCFDLLSHTCFEKFWEGERENVKLPAQYSEEGVTWLFCVFVSQCSCDRSRKRWGRDVWWWKLSIMTAKTHKSRVCFRLFDAGLLFSCLLQTSVSDYKDAECVLVVWSLCVRLVNYCNWFCWLAGASGQYHVSGHITTDYVLDNTFTKILNLHVRVRSPSHTRLCVCVFTGQPGESVWLKVSADNFSYNEQREKPMMRNHLFIN